jgi:hypothetical protein
MSTWQYLILSRNPQDPTNVEVSGIDSTYCNAATREEAALLLCDELNIDRNLFIACIEVAPGVDVRFSNDGSMLRLSPSKPEVELRDRRKAA